MKIILDCNEFMDTAGIVRGDIKVKALGLTPCCVTGTFCREHKDQILEYCAENPDFHVISFHYNGYFNRFVEQSTCYGLGQGDSNPSLTYLYPLEVHELRSKRHKVK